MQSPPPAYTGNGTARNPLPVVGTAGAYGFRKPERSYCSVNSIYWSADINDSSSEASESATVTIQEA